MVVLFEKACNRMSECSWITRPWIPFSSSLKSSAIEMTLGRTQCLYNVHSVAPFPHLVPSVLRFMLLFHVLSRICDICNASKWAVVWLTSGLIHLGLTRHWKESLRFNSDGLSECQSECWWCSGRFIRTVRTFIPMPLNRLVPHWAKLHRRGSRLTRPPRKSTFASFLFVDLPHCSLSV